MPGFIVSDSDNNKYGILTMKTAWKSSGEGENASIMMGLYIKAVADDDVYNFHKDCFWQLAMSASESAEEVEMQYFQLPGVDETGKETVQDILAYGTADVNVKNLNDDEDEHAIWKLTVANSYSYILRNAAAPIPWKGQVPISSNFWQIGNSFSTRDNTTRTWQMYLERSATNAGVADIKVGGSVQASIWYMHRGDKESGPQTVWT